MIVESSAFSGNLVSTAHENALPIALTRRLILNVEYGAAATRDTLAQRLVGLEELMLLDTAMLQQRLSHLIVAPFDLIDRLLKGPLIQRVQPNFFASLFEFLVSFLLTLTGKCFKVLHSSVSLDHLLVDFLCEFAIVAVLDEQSQTIRDDSESQIEALTKVH